MSDDRTEPTLVSLERAADAAVATVATVATSAFGAARSALRRRPFGKAAPSRRPVGLQRSRG
jgi:hypothetical protein